MKFNYICLKTYLQKVISILLVKCNSYLSSVSHDWNTADFCNNLMNNRAIAGQQNCMYD